MLVFEPEKIGGFVFSPIIFSVVSLQLSFTLRNERNCIFACLFVQPYKCRSHMSKKQKQNNLLLQVEA